MLADWAYSLIQSVLKLFTDGLPEGSATANSGLDSTFISRFLGNIVYYFNVTPILYVLGVCSVCFVAFAIWRLVLFIYNLLPFIR